MEYLEILKEDGAKTGKVMERYQAHMEGALHGVIRIYVTRVKEGRLEFLLQKRSDTKASYPGYYDTACAGHIDAGDCAVTTAVREIKEELGITAYPEDFTFLFCHNNDWLETSGEKAFVDYERDTIFWYHKEVKLEELVLQEEEVASVAWYDARELEAWVKREDSHISFTPKEFARVLSKISNLLKRAEKKES